VAVKGLLGNRQQGENNALRNSTFEVRFLRHGQWGASTPLSSDNRPLLDILPPVPPLADPGTSLGPAFGLAIFRRKAGRPLREIGLRKVHGGSEADGILRFLGVLQFAAGPLVVGRTWDRIALS